MRADPGRGRAALDLLLERLEEPRLGAALRVADVDALEPGAGDGQQALALVEHLGIGEPARASTSPQDLSAEQIDRARRRARLRRSVSCVVGTATELPFEDDSFDALISIGSIKHWPDRPLGLRECVRVVRSGGMVLITETDCSCRYEDMNRFIKMCGTVR